MKLFWLTAAFVLGAILLPPLSQPQSYHAFTDARTLLGVPNFCNTVSNLPFLVVGVAGMVALARRRARGFRDPAGRWPYFAFFAALALTGFGSAYYHLAPDDARLVWDRLPIALACAALAVGLIGDHFGQRAARALLPALAIAAATVAWWHHSQVHGEGNLVPYLAVQLYVVAVALYVLLDQPACYTHRHDLWPVLAIWLLARVAEWLDQALYAGGMLLSGHTLKHLLAALAAALLLRMIQRRTPLDTFPLANPAPRAAP